MLRSVKKSDAEDIFKHINDPDVVRWTLQIPHPYSMGLAYDFIKKVQRKARKKEDYFFGIVDKKSNKVIGGIALEDIDWKNKNGEIAYWLGKDYWDKGIMSEALRLLLDFAFIQLKLHRVYASLFEENVASRRVLEKAGFILEGISRQERFRYDRWHNGLNFGLLEGEYNDFQSETKKF